MRNVVKHCSGVSMTNLVITWYLEKEREELLDKQVTILRGTFKNELHNLRDFVYKKILKRDVPYCSDSIMYIVSN